MKIYLIRHGEAIDNKNDDLRVLTDSGRKQSGSVASFLAKSGKIKISAIYHSTKKRAGETALIFDKYLKPTGGIKEVSGLKPGDDPGIWVKEIKRIKEKEKPDGIMLVGHLPNIEKLAEKLLKAELGDFIKFPCSGVVCLENTDDDAWKLFWMITPEILPK